MSSYEIARHALHAWIRHLEDGRSVADANALAAIEEQDLRTALAGAAR